MAASLTLGTVAVAADGVTVTATIAGGTGTGYGVTGTGGGGLQPHVTSPQGFVFDLTSASVTTTTLTMVMRNPVGSGETFRLDITTGATLTDSGANTPTGQTNLVVTNNSTVTVRTLDPFTDAASFEYNGGFPSSGGAIRQGTSPAQPWTGSTLSDYPIEFVTDATDIALLSLGSAASSVAVDGGTASTPTFNASAFWAVKSLATGLSAGKHLFLLSVGDYFYGARIAGGTRTTYTVATTKRTMLANTASFAGIPATTQVQPWGTYKLSATPSRGDLLLGLSYEGTILDFRFSGSGVEVASIANTNSNWSASIDGGFEGALLAAGDASQSSQNALFPLAKGLAAGSHTIHATFVGSGVNTSVYAVKIINGTATTASSAISDTTLTVGSVATLAVNDWVKIDAGSSREWRQITNIAGLVITVAALGKVHASGCTVTSYSAAAGTITTWTQKDLSSRRMVAMGDSNTEGFNTFGNAGTPDPNGVYYTIYDPRTSAPFLASQALFMELVNLGIQGTNTANQAGRAADFQTYGRGAYDYVTIWEGTNDINGGGVTAAQYGTNVQTQITAAAPYLRAGGKILLLPPGTPVGVTSGAGLNVAACATQLQTLAAANPTTCVYVPNLLSTLVAGDYNGLHYFPSGQQKIADQLIPFLSGLLGGTGMFIAA